LGITETADQKKKQRLRKEEGRQAGKGRWQILPDPRVADDGG